MHRMKGQNQVLNGPKDVLKEEEFDSWRTQTHQAYNNPPISGSGMADPYMPNYYAATTPAAMTFPYVNQTLGDGPWSNGRDPMAQFIGAGGGGDSHHYMESMFGQNSFNSYNQAYNYFPGNAGGDYTTWGGTPRKPTAPYEEYYRETYDQGIDRNSLKHIEQSMGGLSLADHKPDMTAQISKELYAKYSAAAHPVNINVTLAQDHQMVKKYPAVNSDSLVNPSISVKQLSWASVASQPAKPQTKFNKTKTLNNNGSSSSVPSPSNKQNTSNMDIGTWENKNGNAGNITNSSSNKLTSSPTQASSWNTNNSGQRTNSNNYDSHLPSSNQPLPSPSQESSLGSFPSHPILDKLRKDNDYNPKEFDTNPKGARFFIIKSYSEDDIHRSIKYSIWCSTEHGNKRLDQAYREREGKGPIYLLFSVNGSGHFCGVAQMVSPVDYNSSSNIWAQDKWRGQFKVKWIFVKDVPNTQLRQIRLENNDNKPVTNSRDTQEVPLEKGKKVLQIFHQYNHHTSIFDDFLHYEKRQQEDEQRKTQGKSISLKNDN